jgi:type II secretory pathway pseudopilin PulG
MRWLKVLAVAVAVVIVFFVISALVHILYLIGVGLLIAAALFAAVKGWQQYKRAQKRHEERRQQREERHQQREERRARPSIDAPRQQPTGLPIDAPRQQPAGLPPAATPSGFDVEEELARLKRELPDS